MGYQNFSYSSIVIFQVYGKNFETISYCKPIYSIVVVGM